jgi:hypothetical protein
MPDVPELRAAVRASAHRRYGRPRRRAARRLLPAVALVAVVLIALVLVPSSTLDVPSDEVAATPTPTPTADGPVVGQPPGTDTRASALASIASVYGVFRRPARATDRVRGLDAMVSRGRTTLPIELDQSNARRLATDGIHALYAVPGLRNGRTALCTYKTRRSRPASLGCGEFDPERAHTRPGWSKTFYRPAPLYALLVPDGVETVDVHLKSGKVVTKRVQDNGVLFAIKGLKRIVWRDADGTRHSTRATI